MVMLRGTGVSVSLCAPVNPTGVGTRACACVRAARARLMIRSCSFVGVVILFAFDGSLGRDWCSSHFEGVAGRRKAEKATTTMARTGEAGRRFEYSAARVRARARAHARPPDGPGEEVAETPTCALFRPGSSENDTCGIRAHAGRPHRPSWPTP